MFTATLIAAPGNLDVMLPENLRNAFGGSDVTWLAPDEAAEFTIYDVPSHARQIWQDLQSAGVDLVFQPTQNRQKKMLLADMDSTMIQQECIDELAAEAGVGERVADITARAMNGELDFEGALIERVGLLRGLPLSVIDKVYAERITMIPGGKTLIATMKAQGGHAALVSGGFTAFTEKVAAELGFDEHQANTLLSDGDALSGDVGRPILGREAKVDALNAITVRLGITPADVLAVGDGANDLGMLHAAGTGVALHAKPSVQEQAEVVVNHGDLTALLYLQGINKEQFV